MQIMTHTGSLINLDKVQAITFREAYTEEYKQGIGTVQTWSKDAGYEVVAETERASYVIQVAADIPDALRILDEIARDIRNIGGEIIIMAPALAEDIPY